MVVDIVTPSGWSARGFWLHHSGRASGCIFAFAPSFFAVGIEFMTGECKGIAFMCGPFWLGLGTIAAQPDAAEVAK